MLLENFFFFFRNLPLFDLSNSRYLKYNWVRHEATVQTLSLTQLTGNGSLGMDAFLLFLTDLAVTRLEDNRMVRSWQPRVNKLPWAEP